MKKRLCLSLGGRIERCVLLVLVGLLFMSVGFVGAWNNKADALTFSQAVDVSFDFNPTLSVSLSSSDLKIPELVPGNVADSNVITIGVSTNAAFGYTLSANVGNDTNYDTRSLIRADDDTSEFASIATDATMSTITTDNAWGFSSKLTTDGASWANYSGLPLYSDTENTKTILETSSPEDTNTVDFKIAAKAGNTITAGEYKNVINFIAVAKPEPIPAPIACEENKICYSKNALDTVEGTMGKQPNATSNSSVTLLASNYSRTGYGFAGWNTAPDYSGTNYGPNEDVIMPADMSNGLSLYAMWVKSAGIMQEWDGCVGLNKGDVTALTDARDNDTYAVAKLADGKCWMIENLRLDNTADHNSDGSLSQGYGDGFIGLAEPELNNFSSSVATANSLYTTESDVVGMSTISGGYYRSSRFPRYKNVNTSQRVENVTSARTINYGYGNYYTWAAAIADIADYVNGNSNSTSICPAGWALPRGGNKRNEMNNDYWGLIVDSINNGIKPSNYGSTIMPYYTGNPEGSDVSVTLRAYPNNFLYAGICSNSFEYYLGSGGYYWSSTAYSGSDSYHLYLASSDVRPGTYYSAKSDGRSVRCVVGS